MPTQKPFRFGVAMARADSRQAWLGKVRRAEALGYSVVLLPDHFGDQLGPALACLAAAEATTTTRVGTGCDQLLLN